MTLLQTFLAVAAGSPVALMLLAMLGSAIWTNRPALLWKLLAGLSALAVLAALSSLALVGYGTHAGLALDGRLGAPWLRVTVPGAVLALLVQFLVTVIGGFSARYLRGEPNQARYVGALASVLAAVQLLLLADHWLPLIAAWAAVGLALERLLCFYGDRPFALLAAHKKQIADRLADVFLIVAAVLAWHEVGSGSFTDLAAHLSASAPTAALQASAVLVALAVILRCALLPMHGWLIQVMEAPTPVSALLHAGVVNLGGYVLVRLSPLLEHATVARWTLVVVGLASALLAGMVMLTRISIKVRLAWSTVAQMGFMVVECGLGLGSLALLHLIGHSLYKAHTFLAASDAVRQTRLQDLRGDDAPSRASLVLAPAASLLAVLATQAAWHAAWPAAGSVAAWPWWWTAVLALAWAPLLWVRASRPSQVRDAAGQVVLGLVLTMLLATAALAAHSLALGGVDAPDAALGAVTLAFMLTLYLVQAAVHVHAQSQPLSAWRRWSYAGFYLDEFSTRLALRVWPTRWTPPPSPAHAGQRSTNSFGFGNAS